MVKSTLTMKMRMRHQAKERIEKDFLKKILRSSISRRKIIFLSINLNLSYKRNTGEKFMSIPKERKKNVAKAIAKIIHNVAEIDCEDLIEDYINRLIFNVLAIPDEQNCLIVIKSKSSDTTITVACSLFPCFKYGIQIKHNGKKYTKYISTVIYINGYRDSDRKASTMRILKKKSDRKYFYTDNFLIDKLERYL